MLDDRGILLHVKVFGKLPEVPYRGPTSLTLGHARRTRGLARRVLSSRNLADVTEKKVLVLGRAQLLDLAASARSLP